MSGLPSRAIECLHARDHDRDVIVATPLIRHIDQPIHRRFNRIVHDDLADLGVGDETVQPIAAEDDVVTDRQRHLKEIDRDLLMIAD